MDDQKKLKTKDQASTSSKLAPLNSHIDGDQSLLIRGRLENAILRPERKAPIILPSNDHLTHLIIDDLHRENSHVGLKHVISKLRKRFWVLRCVSEVMRILGRCMFCRRLHQLMTQQMVPEDHASAAVWRLEERNRTLYFVYLDARKEQCKMIDGLDKERKYDKLKTIGWKFIPQMQVTWLES